jgi:hypothetical protein
MNSLILAFVLVLSVVGAVADLRYKKAGGKPSSRRAKIIFFSVVLLVAGTIAALVYLGYNQESFGMITGPLAVMITVSLAVWLFFTWELGRWRMRRKYPLPPKTKE